MSADVTIVRPYRTGRQLVIDIVGGIGNLFFAAWVLWAIGPMTELWEPSYWQAFATVCAVRVVLPSDITTLRTWTKAGSR
jgi:uncharacterized membrane protein